MLLYLVSLTHLLSPRLKFLGPLSPPSWFFLFYNCRKNQATLLTIDYLTEIKGFLLKLKFCHGVYMSEISDTSEGKRRHLMRPSIHNSTSNSLKCSNTVAFEIVA